MTQATQAPEVGAVLEAGAPALGQGPRQLALRRLRRNRPALGALVVFLAVVAISLAAPLYAERVAKTDPFGSNLSGTTIVDGKKVDVLQQSSGLGLGVTPIGPTWDVRHFFLGADSEGRDVAARVLYGGRASLSISIAAALGSSLVATLLALGAGFFGGLVDTLISRLMDMLWAFPVFLLAILISTVSLTQGLQLGPLVVDPGSLALPIVIITVIFVPYAFRPIRGQVFAVRERDFVKAAIVGGASNRWLIFREILPNVITTVLVLLPLMIAVDILVESGLSFLGIGVQPPQASWGTIIGNGQGLIYSRPGVALAPGLMILAVVLSLNVLGDGIRDALDPRAKLRLKA